MEIVRIIASSRNLARLLKGNPGEDAQPARFSYGLVGDSSYAELNRTLLGPAQRPFQAFELQKERANRLHAIAAALTEQPITLVWDGEWMTITHFTI
jgi:hypothetical protein